MTKLGAYAGAFSFAYCRFMTHDLPDLRLTPRRHGWKKSQKKIRREKRQKAR